MKKLLITFLMIGSGLAQPVHVKLDSGQTQINFVLGDVLHTVHGTFKLSDGDIWMDPGTGKAAGQILVRADTGDSGSRARDSRMNKNVLETSLFPTIKFMPDRLVGKFSQTGDSSFQLHGIFDIHGATHELTMAVKSHISGAYVIADATFDVPYVQWGMRDPSTLFLRVDKTVRIEITTAGIRE